NGSGTGTLTVESTGELEITGTGSTLDGVIVTDSNASDGIDVASGAILTLDGGTQIKGSGTGTLVIDSSGQLAITGAATLDGLVVDDDTTTSGILAGIYVASGVLTLDDGTQIQGGGIGTMTIASTAELFITSGSGATLDGVIVTDSNATDGIDVASILTLNDSTSISGGTLTVESTGQLVIAAGAGAVSDNATAGGARLDGVIVTDSNASDGIDVASGAILTLDGGTQINGSGTGTLTVESTGELEITGTGATLNGVIVTDSNASDGIDVASGAILTLDGGTQIKGSGTGTLTVESGGQLQITTATGATLDGVIVDDDATGTGSSAGIYVASGILTLDDGTQIQGGGTGTMTIASTGELSITSGSGAT